MAFGFPVRRSRPTIRRARVAEILEKVLTDIGPERFSGMKLLDLERTIRTYDLANELPGKTVLRELIHSFRRARWSGTEPKPVSPRLRR